MRLNRRKECVVEFHSKHTNALVGVELFVGTKEQVLQQLHENGDLARFWCHILEKEMLTEMDE